MTSLTAYRRNHHRRGKRTFETLLAAIPEEQSCRDWQIHSTPPTTPPPTKGITYSVSKIDLMATSMCYRLIAKERQSHGIDALSRSEKLHHLARLHANRMARMEKVSHSVLNLAELQELLQSSLVGENVQRGQTPATMHRATMTSLDVNRKNILGGHFHEFGVAAAQGSDGYLYVCSYFR